MVKLMVETNLANRLAEMAYGYLDSSEVEFAFEDPAGPDEEMMENVKTGIEILYRLHRTKEATSYKKCFYDNLTELISCAEDPEYIKEIRNDLKIFWSQLKENPVAA